MTIPNWLNWAQRLQAIAQNGLAYCENQYDRERYDAVARLALEIIGAQSSADPAVVHDLMAQDAGYATPKIDVRGAVIRNEDQKILLVREIQDGGWTLPGGWADVGQSAAESVVREVSEESGYNVRAVKLVAVMDRNKHAHPPIVHHAFKLFFQCELLGGAARASNETSEVEWFAEHDLPALSLARVLPEQIHMMFDHYRNPNLPTYFD